MWYVTLRLVVVSDRQKRLGMLVYTCQGPIKWSQAKRGVPGLQHTSLRYTSHGGQAMG